MDTIDIIQITIAVVAVAASLLNFKDLIGKLNAERRFSKKVSEIKFPLVKKKEVAEAFSYFPLTQQQANLEIMEKQLELIRLIFEVDKEKFTSAEKLTLDSETRLRKIIDLVDIDEGDKGKLLEGLRQPSERSKVNYARKLQEEILKSAAQLPGE